MKALFMAVMAIAVSTPATAESLAIAPQPGFIVGHHVANAEQSIDELIPAGETVEAWTRMITIQRFALRPGLTAHTLMSNVRGGWLRSCPGSAATPVAPTTVAGRTGTQMRADCPLNPETGKPEVMLARMVVSGPSLHGVQIAFRGKPSSADLAWAERALASIALKP